MRLSPTHYYNNLNAGTLLTITNYYLGYRQRTILLHGHHSPNTTICQRHIPILLQYKGNQTNVSIQLLGFLAVVLRSSLCPKFYTSEDFSPCICKVKKIVLFQRVTSKGTQEEGTLETQRVEQSCYRHTPFPPVFKHLHGNNMGNCTEQCYSTFLL